jgi:hypothetical protein
LHETENVMAWSAVKDVCLSCFDQERQQVHFEKFYMSYIVEQELLTLPGHLSSPLVFSEFHVTRSLV